MTGVHSPPPLPVLSEVRTYSGHHTARLNLALQSYHSSFEPNPEKKRFQAGPELALIPSPGRDTLQVLLAVLERRKRQETGIG